MRCSKPKIPKKRGLDDGARGLVQVLHRSVRACVRARARVLLPLLPLLPPPAAVHTCIQITYGLRPTYISIYYRGKGRRAEASRTRGAHAVQIGVCVSRRRSDADPDLRGMRPEPPRARRAYEK
mgnify:CR=1 FL=1